MASLLQIRGAVGALILARVVYAVNWLNVGAIFILMMPDLGVSVSGLGTLTSAFFLGVGLMQVPGGLMAAMWGAKRVVVSGVFLASGAALLTSLLSSIVEIAVLRFVVGAGMALVFAPGVVLVAKIFAGGKFGMGVGLFNSAFDFGGVIGLFGWVVLAGAFGWRPSLALSGALGLVTGVLVLVYVPGDSHQGGGRPGGDVLKRILGDRQLVLLGAATLGFGIGNTVISGFMIEYLVKGLGYAPSTAGLVASLVVVVPIVTSILGGRLYDRSRRGRTLMVLSLLGSSSALAFGAFPSIYSAIASSGLGGAVSGVGYTVAFAGARDLNRAGKQYDGLAIAWVNSLSLSGLFFPPLLYSYLVEGAGYSDAWLGSALVSLAFLVPLLGMKENFRS